MKEAVFLSLSRNMAYSKLLTSVLIASLSSDIKKQYIQKAMFSISAVFPSVIFTTESAYIISLLLKTCLNVVDEQINKNPAMKGHKRKTFHFKRQDIGNSPATIIT